MTDWISAGAAAALIFILVFVATRTNVVEEGPAGPPAGPKEGNGSGGPSAVPPEPSSTRSVTVTTTPTRANLSSAALVDALPRMEYEDDDDVDPTRIGQRATAKQIAPVPTKKIIYDEDAASDDPTQPSALILVTATAQTDKGLRRKRNEDSLLAIPSEGVYVVADGMGGYRGGEVASELAVKTIEKAFAEGSFEGEPHTSIPRRASELVRAVQMANEAILARATEQKELAGMGTTICAARFSQTKQRVYVAHVGDSRMYRARGGKLQQMTSDHTMRDLGVTGQGAEHLSRAVGVWPIVPVDVLLAEPRPGDLYLLCSDGLTKMLDDAAIARIIATDDSPAKLVDDLIAAANASGGKDNITVIIVRVSRSVGSA